jgi:hypothetical protein
LRHLKRKQNKPLNILSRHGHLQVSFNFYYLRKAFLVAGWVSFIGTDGGENDMMMNDDAFVKKGNV